MTGEERKALRESLIGLGFKRTTYTTDMDGSGRYTEVFCQGDNLVEIQWGRRTKPEGQTFRAQGEGERCEHGIRGRDCRMTQFGCTDMRMGNTD